jgi:glutathione S-transferase
LTAINPKGYVPVLELDDGVCLTEVPAIVQYIADRMPESGLAPRPYTLERYQLQEWLGFINSELHQGLRPTVQTGYAGGVQAEGQGEPRLSAKLRGRSSAGQHYLLGDQFTVADSYLFTVLGWGSAVAIDIGQWPTLRAFQERVGQRQSVLDALKAEE